MASTLLLLEVWGIACIIALLYVFAFVGRRGRGFPPGPPTLPLIGNLHQLPRSGAHLRFTEWAQKYGGLFSLKLGPATAVVITDRKLVKALVDKKSAIYSDRPPSYVSNDLITRGDNPLIMGYGEKWRSVRKLIHNYFNESRVEREYLVLQNAEAVQMMHDFWTLPDDFMKHPKRYSNSIIMSLLFGVRSTSAQAPHLVQLYDMMEGWSRVMETGATPPVDVFPFLKWIPERVFGGWVTHARNVGKVMETLYGRMVSRVMQRRLQVGSRDSFLDDLLDQQEKRNLNHHEVKFLCGGLMEGGSDTSSSILLAFLHAMIKFPQVQKKAQREIDSVVTEDRSPLWSDYTALPYVSQIVKETMRWRPVLPLAFPHALLQDDIVDGMALPKGSTVILNVWGLHHDSIRFPNPDEFDPERFAGRTLLSPVYASAADYESRDHYSYGSGRRICPGIHLAERNLFLGMAKLLWAFEFSESKDEHENPIPLNVDPKTAYSEGFLHCPKPFDCEIRLRSDERGLTIAREFAEAESNVFSKYES